MSEQIVMIDRATQIKALSSEVRIKVLQLLADPKGNFQHQWSADPSNDGVCMSLIAEEIGVAQPTASRHLDILRQARFVTITRIGKWGHCKRDENAIREYLSWVTLELQL